MSHAREFHRAFDLPAPDHPTAPNLDLASLRMRLITEEYKEVKEDFDILLRLLRSGKGPNDDEVVEVLQRVVKEVCDLRYVAEGALVSFGVEPDAYNEVHRSNMSKLGPDGRPLHRDDGKVLKGPGYTPADPNRLFPSIINIDSEEE